LPATAFQTYNPATAASIQPGPLALFTVPVNKLRPTQMNEGFTEVDKKATGFDILTPSQLQPGLIPDIEPVVIGPGGVLYLTDGHHTFTALLDSAYVSSNPNVYVNVVANYSILTTSQFWAQMQASNLLLPLNDGAPQIVNTANGAPILTSLTALTQDPYHGLEYSILKNKNSKLFKNTSNISGAAGSAIPGLDKITGTYGDFTWADAYRNANEGRGLPTLSPGRHRHRNRSHSGRNDREPADQCGHQQCRWRAAVRPDDDRNFLWRRGRRSAVGRSRRVVPMIPTIWPAHWSAAPGPRCPAT
jgi:hypothetical protein